MTRSRQDNILLTLIRIGLVAFIVVATLPFYLFLGFAFGGTFATIVVYVLPLIFLGWRFRSLLRKWFVHSKTFRIGLAMFLGLVICLTAYTAWQRRLVKNCYKALEIAVAEQRWEDAYSMMSPGYRRGVSYEEFATKEFEVPKMQGDKTISLRGGGEGIVWPFGDGGDFISSGYYLEFRRVDGDWYCDGELGLSVF